MPFPSTRLATHDKHVNLLLDRRAGGKGVPAALCCNSECQASFLTGDRSSAGLEVLDKQPTAILMKNNYHISRDLYVRRKHVNLKKYKLSKTDLFTLPTPTPVFLHFKAHDTTGTGL